MASSAASPNEEERDDFLLSQGITNVQVAKVTDLEKVPPEVAAVLRHTIPAADLRTEGQHLQQHEEYQAALEQYKQALWHYQQAYGDGGDSIDYMRSHSLVVSMIDILHELNSDIEQQRLQHNVMDHHAVMYEDIYNLYRDFSQSFPHNVETASVLARWSSQIKIDGDVERAITTLDQAVNICERIFVDTPDEQFAVAYMRLASCYLELEEHPLAVHNLQQALHIYQSYGAAGDEIETCRQAIGIFQEKVDETSSGIEL